MNKLFNAEEANNERISKLVCACGKLKEDWQDCCTACYSKKMNGNKREEIQYAQSWNLAASMVAFLSLTTSEKKEQIEEWQQYFYKKLTEKNGK